MRRDTARGVEQTTINRYGLRRNGGQLSNKINSISRLNPRYRMRMRLGREALIRAGRADLLDPRTRRALR